MGLSKNKVCLKCEEGGDLLTCSRCPLVIHEGCMTCSAKYDETGNFYCPYCWYKRSVAELSLARKKVKLTRKALSIFMDIASKEHKNEAETGNIEGEKVQEDESETSSASTDQTWKEDFETYEESTDKSGEETGNVEGERNQEEESETPLDLTYQSRKEDSETYEESRDKNGEETGNVEGEKIQAEESEASLASTEQTRKENSETYEASTDKSGEREISSKDKNLTREEDCENSSDSNKSSGEEFDDSGSESSKCIQPKRPSIKLDNNIGNVQRRRVMWMEEEVEMLKVGVEKFSSPTRKIIPWKKILHFGRRVFNETRVPMDLKEKWKKIGQKT